MENFFPNKVKSLGLAAALPPFPFSLCSSLSPFLSSALAHPFFVSTYNNNISEEMEGARFYFVKRSVLKSHLESIDKYREILRDKFEKAMETRKFFRSEMERINRDFLNLRSRLLWQKDMLEYLQWVRREFEDAKEPLDRNSEHTNTEVIPINLRYHFGLPLIRKIELGYSYFGKNDNLDLMKDISKGDENIKLISRNFKRSILVKLWSLKDIIISDSDSLDRSIKNIDLLIEIVQGMLQDEKVSKELGKLAEERKIQEGQWMTYYQLCRLLFKKLKRLNVWKSKLAKMSDETPDQETTLNKAKELAEQKDVEALGKLSDKQVDDLVTQFATLVTRFAAAAAMHIEEVYHYAINMEGLSITSREHFTKVWNLRPGTKFYNLTVMVAECISATEFLLGDETGTIIFNATPKQVLFMQKGTVLNVYNAEIVLVDGSMRLQVDGLDKFEELKCKRSLRLVPTVNMSYIKFEVITVEPWSWPMYCSLDGPSSL